MTKYFAITNLITITPLTGCETADTAAAMLNGLFPNTISLIAPKELLITLAANIEEALETDEIGGDPAHVAHLSPEELASDRAMIGEMLHDRIHKDVDNYRPVFSKEKE